MLRSNLSKENVEAFTKEAELMNGLRHPNIAQFIGSSYNTASNLCMVLEWVERGDLFNLLRSDLGQQLRWTDPLLKIGPPWSVTREAVHELYADSFSIQVFVGAFVEVFVGGSNVVSANVDTALPTHLPSQCRRTARQV